MFVFCLFVFNVKHQERKGIWVSMEVGLIWEKMGEEEL